MDRVSARTAASRIRYEERALKELAPDENNPRVMDDVSLTGLAASIDSFGMIQPLVWNERTGELVGGHQRLKVLRSRGVERTMVVVGDWTLEQQRMVNVALNNPAIQGKFTDDLGSYLDDALKGLSLSEFRSLRFDTLFDTPKKEPKTSNKSSEGLRYQIVIVCADEQQQAELLDELVERDLEVKAMIL